MSADACKVLKMCSQCGHRKALFQSKQRNARRRLHTDRKHDLCPQCWRDYRNTYNAKRLPLNLAAAFVLMLLCAIGGQAQTTTTVIGAIKDLTGTIVPGGQVTFELRPGGDTTITGNGRFTPSTVTCTINQSDDFSATGVARAANVVTVTFTTPHSFLAGDVVTVSSMTDTSFNGTFTIATVADTSHVTWAQTGSNGSTGAGIISALRASPGPGSCKVTQNTALQPAGTGYNVCLWPLGARTSCFNWYAIGVGPIDLSTAVPTPGSMPIYAFVDTLNNQTIAGNKTFSGTVNFTGQVIFPTAFALNGIFSSSAANAATAGIFRTANNENALCMRNAANSSNLCLILDNTNTLKFNGSALGTGGTVTNTSVGNFSPLFNASVATSTTTPAVTYAAISQGQNLLYASPNGGSGNPTFRALASGDFPSGLTFISPNLTTPVISTTDNTGKAVITLLHELTFAWNGTGLEAFVDGVSQGCVLTTILVGC